MLSGKQVVVDKVAVYNGHSDCIYTMLAGPTANTFFTTGADGMVVQWDLNTPNEGTLIAKMPKSVYALTLANEGTQLLVAQNFEGIHLLDLETKQELATKALGNVAIFDLMVIGNEILAALANGQVIKLAYPQIEIIHQTRHTEQSARRLAQHPNLPGLVAVAYSDGVIRLLETNTLKIVEELQGHTNSVFVVQFSPDGKYLLSGGRDAKLKVWDAQNNFELVQDIPAHLFAINDIYFHPFKPLFATCSMDKSVKVWSAETFKLLKVIDKSRHAGHGNSVNRLLWTTANELLISTGDDRNIHLWKLSL